MSKKLKFRGDGSFVIVQFTDIHWQNGNKLDQKSRVLMENIIQAEQPDLIVYTGDVIAGGGCEDPGRSYHEAIEAAEKHGIPWAAVFGNHDDEGSMSRRQLLAVQQQMRHGLSQEGPADIAGVSNYILEIEGESQPAALLYFMDSGSYSPIASVGGYDWFRRDQIDWYLSNSRAYTMKNEGRPLPALAFFHIPLPEYNDIWNHHTCYGNKLEEVCCPKLNTGMFAAMVEMGDVLGTFVGHDHVNDYMGELHGIHLCYGRASGYNTYPKYNFSRGARIIRLYKDERRFDSWLRLDDGTVVGQMKSFSDKLWGLGKEI